MAGDEGRQARKFTGNGSEDITTLKQSIQKGQDQMADISGRLNRSKLGGQYALSPQDEQALQGQLHDLQNGINEHQSRMDAANKGPQNQALDALNARAGASGNLDNIMGQYAQGKVSLNDALGQASKQAGGLDRAYTDPSTGSALASQFVQNDQLTKGLFGKGGVQDQAQGRFGELEQERQGVNPQLAQDREALSGKGEQYGLTNQDLTAYGQASGNVARMFGQQEQGLAQSLANRGLSSGGSGAAGAQFTGLQGNKMEQLGQLQTQIAQNRINTAKDLAQFRTNADLQKQAQVQQAQAQNNAMIQGLGAQGQQALQNQYGRQFEGAQKNYNELAGTSNQNMANQGLQQGQMNEEFAQKEQTRTPSFGEVLGHAGAGLLGGVAGGFGSALGGAAGKGLGKLL